jgi:hypothetical protein
MPDVYEQFNRSVSGHTHYEEWCGHPVEVCAECNTRWPCDVERAARRAAAPNLGDHAHFAPVPKDVR